MFYGQCWKCGERWELGTASSCKCPDELDASNYRLDPPGLDPLYTFKQSSEPVFAFLDTKTNYNISFHRDGKQIGVLDFNGPEMVFSGDMDESAKVFFDYVATAFKARLEQERADERNRTWTQEHWTEYERSIVESEREACAKAAEDFLTKGRSPLGKSVAAAIRARSNT